MNVRETGSIGVGGAVQPGVSIITSTRFAALISWRDTLNIAVFEIRRAVTTSVWRREIKQTTRHAWAGHEIPLNVSSILPVAENRFFVASGTERLLLDGEKGAVLASGTAPASPTAPVALIGGELVVAEGQKLSGYDATTLKLAWSEPIPGKMWAFAPPVERFLPIEEETGVAASLWRYQNEALWKLPGVTYVRAQPLLTNDSLVIVASGLGAPEQVTALDQTDGSLKWCVSFRRRELLPPPAPAPSSVPYAASLHGDFLIVITATPSVEAITIAEGASVWRMGLASEPTVLAKAGDVAWVASIDGTVTCLDLRGGSVIGLIDLPGTFKNPVAVIPLTDTRLSQSALVITRLGRIFQVTLN